jgi:hypothetical protein
LSEGGQGLSRDQARILNTGGPKRIHWQPWPRRGQSIVRAAAV